MNIDIFLDALWEWHPIDSIYFELVNASKKELLPSFHHLLLQGNKSCWKYYIEITDALWKFLSAGLIFVKKSFGLGVFVVYII